LFQNVMQIRLSVAVRVPCAEPKCIVEASAHLRKEGLDDLGNSTLDFPPASDRYFFGILLHTSDARFLETRYQMRLLRQPTPDQFS
jgi:hypothetical protein